MKQGKYMEHGKYEIGKNVLDLIIIFNNLKIPNI